MFFMFGSFSIIMGIFVFFFIPETKGLSLESMDELFGVTDLVSHKLDGDGETGKAPSVHQQEHAAKSAS
jgi:hypothetical protein